MSRTGTAVDAMLARPDLFRFDDEPAADAMLSRPDLFKFDDEVDAGPSPIPNEPSGVVGSALSSAIRFLSPAAGVFADEAARGLVRGSIGIPESAAGAVQAAGGVMESMGKMADIAPAAGIDLARRTIQNPGQAVRAALLGQPMPIDDTSIATMQAGAARAESSPNVLAQTGTAIRQATDPAMEFYGQAKADPALAPSPLAQAEPFSPSGLTSSVAENLPQLAVQLAAAYASGGAGATGRIAGFAGSAFPMELGAAQAAGREGFMSQGMSADEASQLAAPGSALQAAVNTLIEGLSGAGIFSEVEKAAAKAGLFRKAWQILKGGTRATVTGGATEYAQEGVNIAGELASGSNPNAGQGAGMRMAQAGIVGGLLEGPAGAFEGFRSGQDGRQEDPGTIARIARPPAPSPSPAPTTTPASNPTAAPTIAQDAPGVAPDPEAVPTAEAAQAARVDGLLAILEDDTRVGTPEWDAARAEIDAMFPGLVQADPAQPTTDAAPVGSPSPADQVASSRPEQAAPVDPQAEESGAAPQLPRRVDRTAVRVSVDPNATAPAQQGRRVADRLKIQESIDARAARTPDQIGRVDDRGGLPATQGPAPEVRPLDEPGPDGTVEAGVLPVVGDEGTPPRTQPGDVADERARPVEPWQMTRREYAAEGAAKVAEANKARAAALKAAGNLVRSTPGGLVATVPTLRDPRVSAALDADAKARELSQDYSAYAHKVAVGRAMFEGKPVPAEVLAEYGLSNPPAEPDSSTQPQGSDAAQPPTQEPRNGEETQGRPQGLLTDTGTAAPSSAPQGTGAVSAAELETKPRSELVKMARAAGVSAGGTKAELVARLAAQPAPATPNVAPATPDVAAPVEPKPAKKTPAKPTKPAADDKIEDTGEKIGGARKDVWAKRGITVADIEKMNEREAYKYTNKDAAWPKPDYAAMVQDGVAPIAARMLKVIRDNIAASPSADSKEARVRYLEGIAAVRPLWEAARTVEDVKALQDAVMVALGLKAKGEQVSGYEWRNKPAYKAYLAMFKGTKSPFALRWVEERRAARDVAAGWPAKAEAKGDWFTIRKRAEGAYQIFKGEKTYPPVVRDMFPTEEAARAYATENFDKAGRQKTSGPQRPTVEGVSREGPDYRGGRDIDANEFRDVFGFRGVEFGNWMTQEDRQQTLNHAYDGLMDLATAMGIPPLAVSLNGHLSAAFGSRGKGGDGAAAHYEATRRVFNLTKMSGQGSLAHEWAHAFDDYLGSMTGVASNEVPYASELVKRPNNKLRPEVLEALRNVVKTIREVPATVTDEVAERTDRLNKSKRQFGLWLDQWKKGFAAGRNVRGKQVKPTDAQVQQFNDLVESARNTVAPAEAIDKAAELYGSIYKVNVDKDTANALRHYADDIPRLSKTIADLLAGGRAPKGVIPTAVLTASRKADSKKSKPYWSTDLELFARMFEMWVYDRLAADQGKKNVGVSQYLVNNISETEAADPQYWQGVHAFGVERTAIGQAMGDLVASLRVEETTDGKVTADAPINTRASAADRVASTFDRIARDAEARMEKRAKERGVRLYSTPLPNPRDVIDTAIWIAAKVAKAGVKSYGAIRRIINQSLAERPGTKRRAAQIGREVLAILRESRSPERTFDQTKFEEAVGRRVNGEPTTAKQTGQAARAIDGKEKDAPTVTEAEALKARYKGERKASNAADREARKEERTKAKKSMRERIAVSKFELSQMREVMRAATSDQAKASSLVHAMLKRTAEDLDRQLTKAQISEAMREQLVRTITETLPVSVRGKLLTDVRDVKTMSDLARTLGKARKVLAQYEGRAAIVEARKKTRRAVIDKVAPPRLESEEDAKKLTIKDATDALNAARTAGPEAWNTAVSQLARARRDVIDEQIQIIGAEKQKLAEAKSIEAMESAAAKLRDAVDTISELLAAHRSDTAVTRGQNRADASEWVSKVLARLKTQHDLRPKDPDGKRLERPFIERAALRMLSGETFAMALDNTFADNVTDDTAPIRKLLYDDIIEAQNRKFEIVEDAMQKLDKMAKDAGYLNAHDALRVLGEDVLGDASTQYVDVRVGERKRIPLGLAAKIYAFDPETKFKALNGRRFNFADDPTGTGFRLTPGTFAAIERALPLELRRFIDAAKTIRDDLRPAMFATHRALKGFEPIAVDQYEPTRVNPWKREDEIATGDPGAAMGELAGFESKAWENSGFTQARMDNAKAPLLITNWMNDLLRSIDGSASLIAVAPAVANARNTLATQPVIEALSARLGPGAVERMAELIAIGSGVSMAPDGKFARIAEDLARGVTKAVTQFSEQSHLKQLGGIPKIGAEMPTGYFLRGVAGAFDPSVRERMMQHTTFLRARASMPSQALFSSLGSGGALPTEGSIRSSGRAVAASAKAAAVSTKDAAKAMLSLEFSQAQTNAGMTVKHMWDVLHKSIPAILDRLSIAHWFDQLPARVAWAGFEAQAKAEGKGLDWVAKQTERAMRRSANPTNAMDQSGFAIAMRRSGLGALIPFTGDPYKSFDQLYRAHKVGGAYRAKVYAGVMGNVLWSAAVSIALRRAWEEVGRAIAGGDEPDEEKYLKDAAEKAAWLAAKDLIGILPLGNMIGAAVDVVRGGFGNNDVISSPAQSTISRAAQSLQKVVRAIDAKMGTLTEEDQARYTGQLMEGLWETGANLSALLGLPGPVVDRIQRNIRAGMKEEPMSEKVQRFKESMGGPTREEKRLETRNRKRLLEALGRQDVDGAREALKALREDGEPVKWLDVRRAFNQTDPLASVPKQDREKFLQSLKPKARAEVLDARRKWQEAQQNLSRVWQDAQR